MRGADRLQVAEKWPRLQPALGDEHELCAIGVHSSSHSVASGTSTMAMAKRGNDY